VSLPHNSLAQKETSMLQEHVDANVLIYYSTVTKILPHRDKYEFTFITLLPKKK
jgi:hypothetical protein